MKFTNITFLIAILMSICHSPCQAIIYGILIQHNPTTGHLVIHFADFHEKEKPKVVKKIQNQIISLILYLGIDNTHVIVEDMGSMLLKQYNAEFNLLSFITSNDNDKTLRYFAKVCQIKKIQASNVEFRDCKEYTQTKKNSIEKKAKDIMDKLENYFDDDIYLDANIIRKIKKYKQKNIIVFAGGLHIGSVSRYLFKSGYTQFKIHSYPKETDPNSPPELLDPSKPLSTLNVQLPTHYLSTRDIQNIYYDIGIHRYYKELLIIPHKQHNIIHHSEQSKKEHEEQDIIMHPIFLHKKRIVVLALMLCLL